MRARLSKRAEDWRWSSAKAHIAGQSDRYVDVAPALERVGDFSAFLGQDFLLAIVPAIVVSMTSFVRITVVLAMVRHAFGMPETPPNAVLVSLGLFLTAFTMAGPIAAVNRNALQPLMAGTIGVEQAVKAGSGPIRDFMLSQTRDADIEAIYAVAKAPVPARPDQVEIVKLAPAFMLNELRTAFTIGFVILLPFLVIDLVVSSILLALGMMMVPPSTISLPIKLLMFVLIDGWRLIIVGVLGSFG